ncbi:MAG: ERF family protein [Cypionkella sp.]|nr:ERF family protein [Cypionkella sp.]
MHTSKTYSTLDDLIRTARPVLSAHGLSLSWQTAANGDEYSVTAIVRHSRGHSIQTTLSGKRDTGKQMNALQGGGSTETYLKRYTGFSLLGLSSGDEVDDDGRASTSSATITADQYIALRDKAETAGIAEEVICKAHGVANLHEFLSKDFDAAMRRLDKNIAEKVAK